MLTIKNISANINTEEILSDINIEIQAGEIHALIGPKESGKTTLAHLIQGNPHLTRTSGTILYGKKNINKLTAEKRAKLGIFTCFQYPPEIVGLTNLDMARSIFETMHGVRMTSDVETAYINMANELELGTAHVDEQVNSANTDPTIWRKNEILQMMIANPEFVIFDEIDAELDAHSLELMSKAITAFVRGGNKACLILTRNLPFLDLLKLDKVHILVDGKIKAQGTEELYKRITEDGYTQFS
jgi:Fe-S cluster assembly ATP-binding protein